MDIEDLMPMLQPITVQAWLETPLDVSNPLLVEVLQKKYEKYYDPKSACITLPELATATLDGTPAWGGHQFVTHTPNASAVQQAYSYIDSTDTANMVACQDALQRAQACLVIREQLPGIIMPKPRMESLSALLRILDEVLEPLTWVIPTSESIGALGERPGSLYDGLLKIRRMSSNAAHHAWIVDTVGAEPLAIPDFQCHFKGIEPARVEQFVVTMMKQFVSGTTMLAEGDPVIIPGDAKHEPIFMTAEVEMSNLPPLRRLLALKPQGEYAPES